MIGPDVPARVEERSDLSGVRIEPRDIRPLEQITMYTCECEIRGVITAAVLFGNEVFDMECRLIMLLPKPAILATLSGPLPDEIPRRCVHQEASLLERTRRALAIKRLIRPIPST
jgi:hypothetical protein